MIPVSLEIKNFFSHRDSFIDFTQFDSALLIGNIEGNYDISNGSGKSAIFQSILWCLFNKTRAAAMDDVISWGENFCKVCFVFKHEGCLYRVSRKRSRVNSTTFIDFSKQDAEGNWIDISGSTSSLTNAEIEKVIKFDYKTFVNSIYFGQNDISEFAETDASRKKEILKSIIDLSKWDDYEDMTKNKLREMKGETKILASKLEGFETLIIEFENSKTLLKEQKNELGQASERRKLLDESIATLSQRYFELKQNLDTNLWDQTVEKLAKLQEKKKKLEDKVQTTKVSFDDYQTLIATKKEQIAVLAKKAQNLVIDEEVDLKLKLLNDEMIDLKSRFNSSKEMLKNLEERVISNGQCYVCNQKIDDLLYQQLQYSHLDDLEKYQKVNVYAQNKINEIIPKIKDLEKVKENNKAKEDFLTKIRSLETELVILEERTTTLQVEIEQRSLELSRTINDLEINEKVLESIRNDDFKSLQNQRNQMREEQKELYTKIENLNRQVGVLLEKTSNLSIKIEEARNIKKEYLQKQKNIAIMEKAVRLLGKNGIQVILLNAIIEDLEKTANEILVSICNEPFTIFLDTQRIGSDGVSIVDTLDLRVKKDGAVQNFKSLSGGEQFRISLALRIALSEVSSRHGGSSLEFLLLDEINSPLDRHGTESLFVNVIKSLEKKYKILVITHNDLLKEKFSHILDVTKVNGESSINYLAV